jgi:hypothetical protein
VSKDSPFSVLLSFSNNFVQFSGKYFEDFRELLAFDALFIATNAPGRSAFNRIAMKMAPLSNKFTRLTLPNYHFGSHLNERRITIDANLEKKNFQLAGNILAEIR